jgi:peptide/nickel transport system substrate-binding protein
LLLPALLAGCVKSGATGAQGGRHPWTQPHVLRLVNLADPDSLNSVVGNSQIDVDLSLFWAGYLLNYNDRNQFVPELATEEPTLRNGGIGKDGKTIVYHLRRGVKWQDGAPFGADDVIFTYRAIMNPHNNVNSRTGYDVIDRLVKKDNYTIEIHLKRPWAPFVASFFTMSSTAYPVLPAHLLAKYPDINHVSYNQKPVGTGPFKVAEWQRGTLIRFVANPDYWRGPPKLREIDYRPIADANTILTQLRTHEQDFDFNGSVAHIGELRAIDGDRVDLVPFNAYSEYAFNLKNPILADVAVRQALVAATDRETIVKNVTHGVQLLGEGDQPAFLPWANPKIKIERYDPQRAKRLLDADGWRAGRDGIRTKAGKRLALTIATTTGTATGNAVAVLLQRWWHDIGVDVSIRSYVSSLMFSGYAEGGIVQTGKYDVAFYSWYAGVDPDDSTLFMCDQFPPGGQNMYFFRNRRLDAAEHTALNSYDPAVRHRAYDAIQEMLVDQRPFLTLWFVRRVNVYNTDLQNFKPAHAGVEIWNPWEIDI